MWLECNLIFYVPHKHVYNRITFSTTFSHGCKLDLYHAATAYFFAWVVRLSLTVCKHLTLTERNNLWRCMDDLICTSLSSVYWSSCWNPINLILEPEGCYSLKWISLKKHGSFILTAMGAKNSVLILD